MAKIITVHGTFAHIEASGEAPEGGASSQWWNRNSDFEKSLKNHVDSDGSSGAPGSGIEFRPFIWSGENSELARRKAGSRLLSDLKALEEENEKYCVIAHSHGGSIVASALQEGASKGIRLDGLKRWITVGTPFVQLRPESHLFLRLPLLLKAMFVASMMLLIMFCFYISWELYSIVKEWYIDPASLDDLIDLDDPRSRFRLISLVVPTILSALPFVIYYFIALYFDGQKLFFYKKSNQRQANAAFGERWLPLTHGNDEAVRGLASLSSINMNIFNKEFAVPSISWLSVFVLPLVYVWIVFLSPDTVNRIFDNLKSNIYSLSKNVTPQELESVDELRAYWRELGKKRKEVTAAGEDTPIGQQLKAELDDYRAEYQKFYDTTMASSNNVLHILRVQRFERNFIKERRGRSKPVECNGGKLCGGGKDWTINAKLLFYPVYDEMLGLIRFLSFEGAQLRLHDTRLIVSILLVPIVFGVVAIAIVLLFQRIGRMLSRLLSGQLDRQVWFEIRRSALGNDTETEVAVTAVPAPKWVEAHKPFLPADVSAAISQRSNEEMSASIRRIRAAISEFAILQEKDDQLSSALNYLTWRELIHTSYFDVPEFQKLVSYAIADVDGFQLSSAFKSDPGLQKIHSWLEEIEKHKN